MWPEKAWRPYRPGSLLVRRQAIRPLPPLDLDASFQLASGNGVDLGKEVTRVVEDAGAWKLSKDGYDALLKRLDDMHADVRAIQASVIETGKQVTAVATTLGPLPARIDGLDSKVNQVATDTAAAKTDIRWIMGVGSFVAASLLAAAEQILVKVHVL